MISTVLIGTKNVTSKRGLHQCSRDGHTPPSTMFSSVQSLAFVRHYIKVSLHVYSIHFCYDISALIDYVTISEITAHLRSKKLSVNTVEDWEIVAPSFDRFPTVPFTFDEVYWEAYWNIVHQPVELVVGIIEKLNDQRREIEKEQAADEKRNMEKEKAERVVAEKKQEELRLRKRKKIIESPTQSPLSEPPESPFSQDEESPPPKRKSPPPKRRMIESPSPPTSLVARPVRFLSLYVMLFRESLIFHFTFHLFILGINNTWHT